MEHETNNTVQRTPDPELIWIQTLAQQLLGKNNDILKLAFLDGGGVLRELDGMDLSQLSEFKRSGNGAVEIKLVDRTKALEALISLAAQVSASRSDPSGQAEALYRALERQAVMRE